MFSPTKGDVILRGLIGGSFLVMDAMTMQRVAGPLSLQEATGFARQLGVRNIFQQPVDGRGRLLADPLRVEWTSSASRTRSYVHNGTAGADADGT